MTRFAELKRLLQLGPVMAETHVLTPVALDPRVRIASKAFPIVVDCDSPVPQAVEMILIREIDERWANRFPSWRYRSPPHEVELNQYLAQRLDYVRLAVQSQAAAGAAIGRRFLDGSFDCGILMLVDGLSYLSCIEWPEAPEPCFVDGPSITEFGFPEILQTSGLIASLLASRRYQLRAYSYWERDQNDLADRMFAGVPLERVRHFAEALSRLRAISLKGQFVFVLRDGMDEWCHRQREFPHKLRDAAVRTVHEDLNALVTLLREQGQHALIALLADHGVAWRDDHRWRVVEPWEHSWHGRYSETPPSSRGVATRLGTGKRAVHCYHPGLLCRTPRANEAGFHGGLSASESFVPFVVAEVEV